MQYKNQQRDIKQKTETIERFKAKASKASMAQSMMKALDKVERIELPPKSPDINFNFPPIQQSGSVVLTIEDVGHAFGSKQIFKDVSFEVQKGQKIALVASNGVGKTTLFNLIAQKLPLGSGKVIVGYNVHSTVFDQDQTASLAMDKTILENITESCPKVIEQKIRAFSGSFLFTKDSINKKVGVLSGGEKNRVGMIKVLLQNANLLLLDEPTNHLDIQSKDILLTALQSYQGTILFVSHDQDFVNKLATDIVELSVDGAKEYQGNYELYVYQKQQEASSSAKATADRQDVPKKTNNNKKEQEVAAPKKVTLSSSEVKALERTVQKLEHEVSRTENSFAELTFGSAKFNDAQKKLIDLKKELAVALAAWEDSQN